MKVTSVEYDDYDVGLLSLFLVIPIQGQTLMTCDQSTEQFCSLLSTEDHSFLIFLAFAISIEIEEYLE
jgi:hypothetical protein